MTEEQRLIVLLTEKMEWLRPLLTQAAIVLDQRGSRDLRNRLIKDFRFAANVTRTLRHHIDGTVPAMFDDPLPAAPQQPARPMLRIVAGTDMEGHA